MSTPLHRTIDLHMYEWFELYILRSKISKINQNKIKVGQYLSTKNMSQRKKEKVNNTTI